MPPGRKSQKDGVKLLVTVDVHAAALEADLTVPRAAQGIVLFAHGSGSSRFSPRNRQVASVLERAGMATFLLDLLTAEEEEADRETGHLRFNIPFLADRLVEAIDWAVGFPQTSGLTVGYFGASTGAAAALVAAAKKPELVRGVVSRGGRPDLAGEALVRVSTPTLLIVGGEDRAVLALNQQALKLIRSPEKRLEIVPGASHLFEEPGTLERVAELARDWFLKYLQKDEASEAA